MKTKFYPSFLMMFVFILMASSLTVSAQQKVQIKDEQAAYQAYLEEMHTVVLAEKPAPFESYKWREYYVQNMMHINTPPAVEIPEIVRPEEYNHGAESSCTPVFYDGFESGTYTPLWSEGAASINRQVISSDPAQGSYSMKITGSSYFWDGIYKEFPMSQPESVSWWLKHEGSASYRNYVILGGGNTTSTSQQMIWTAINGTSLTFYQNSGGWANIASLSANTWYKVDLRDIDWTNKHFDVYINDVLVWPNFSFINQSLAGINRVDLSNCCSPIGYWDDVNIGCSTPGGPSCPDADGDGYDDAACGGDDCDDADASIYPGAPEICDGIDNNCDGNVDEGFVNTDGDSMADCVDPDDDNDGVLDGADNCPLDANAGQEDGDLDGEGDVCDLEFTACAFVDGMAAYINGLANLPAAYKNVLISRLNLAESRLCSGYNSQARNMLILFKSNVASFKNIGFLSQAEADYLTAGADAFIAAINAGTAACGSCAGNLIAPPTSGISTTTFSEIGLSVFPNPATDQLNIRMAELEAPSTVSIMNTYGQVVWQADLEAAQTSIEINLDSERFTNGVYFVTLHGEITQTQRVVISK